MTIGYGGAATATWTYAPGTRRWVRAEKWSPHLIENDGQVAADNVIVLSAARDTSFAKAKPSMTILDVFDASGTLQLFTGDKVVDGRWTKGDVNDPFTFTTADGKPLLLDPRPDLDRVCPHQHADHDHQRTVNMAERTRPRDRPHGDASAPAEDGSDPVLMAGLGARSVGTQWKGCSS